MATVYENAMRLWFWPLTAANYVIASAETLSGAGKVIDIRMPMIEEAWTNPFGADYAELTTMVSEKMDAFSRSHRSIGTAQERIRRASDANAKAFGRMWGGDIPSIFDWVKIGERSLDILATMATLPANALAPIHTKVQSNVRRLGAS